MPSPDDNAETYYDRSSHDYVAKWLAHREDPTGIYRRETMTSLLDLAGINKGSRVLEVGAGTGLVLRELLERTRPVVGTDVSIEMLRRAGEELAAEGRRVEIVDVLPPNPWDGDTDVWLIQNDLRRPALPAGEFDAILAMEVFRYIEDLDAALRNVAAAMSAGTVLAFTTTNIWSAGLFPLKYELRRRLGWIDPGTELTQHFVTERQLSRTLEKAGLATVEVRRLHCTTFTPLARRLVRSRTGAERLLALDRKLARTPIAKRCFETLLVAAVRRRP